MSAEVFDQVAHDYLTAHGYDSIEEWAHDRGFVGPDDLLRDLLGCEMERGWL